MDVRVARKEWSLNLRHLEHAEISLALVELIERILIRAEYLGRLCPQIARWNIRHRAIPSTMPPRTPNPMMPRIDWSITTRTQCVLSVADSQRNKSPLHKLSLSGQET